MYCSRASKFTWALHSDKVSSFGHTRGYYSLSRYCSLKHYSPEYCSPEHCSYVLFTRENIFIRGFFHSANPSYKGPPFLQRTQCTLPHPSMTYTREVNHIIKTLGAHGQGYEMGEINAVRLWLRHVKTICCHSRKLS